MKIAESALDRSANEWSSLPIAIGRAALRPLDFRELGQAGQGGGKLEFPG
jgi:hypothetical protein